jgi:hypothetical protein
LETSILASQQLKLVEAKYEVVDERLINVLNFFSELGIRRLFLLPSLFLLPIICNLHSLVKKQVGRNHHLENSECWTIGRK